MSKFGEGIEVAMNKTDKILRDISKCLNRKTNIHSMRSIIYQNIFFSLYGDYENIRDKCRRSKDTIANDQKQYPYIPLSSYRFDMMLDYIEKTYGRRESFIDVGCGVGDKTLLAKLSGSFEKSCGIEYDEVSYNIAIKKTQKFMDDIDKSNFNPRYPSFIHGDAFKHSFKPYDTVYLYCPLSSDEMMQKLMNHIYDTINKGSIICFFNAGMDMKKWMKGKDVYIDIDNGFYIIRK